MASTIDTPALGRSQEYPRQTWTPGRSQRTRNEASMADGQHMDHPALTFLCDCILFHQNGDSLLPTIGTLQFPLDWKKFPLNVSFLSLRFALQRASSQGKPSEPTMALTATKFNECCSKFVDKYSDTSRTLRSLEVTRNGYAGWRWIPHSSWPAFSYLTRNTTAKRVRKDSATSMLGSSEEEVDLERELPSVITQQIRENEFVTVVQYIVYSPTFCVPAFYFLIYGRDGAPLSLEDVVSTSLFKPRAFSQTTVHQTHIALEQSQSDPAASVFPLLSQGDHPVLQILCWYFHPCETERAVKELLKERQAEGKDGGVTMGAEQWLETWLVVLSTVVNLEEETIP